jgi:catechol 2,3-dioxygenase-like lactoylglutathione lyase family enzyme
MSAADFASGSALGFALVSVASLETSLAFYRDRIGLRASPIVELEGFEPGFVATGVAGAKLAAPARLAMCDEPGTPVGRVLLVEYGGARGPRVRRPGERTTRGLWNLNFYVDDIRATSRQLLAEGFEFWSEPVEYQVGVKAGTATEVVFEAPDGVAINLVQPLGGPDTFTGRVRAEVQQHGKTRTGFTPVATTAHCVRDLARASAFYRDVLGMRVVLDEILGKPETNHFLARPPDARTHTMFMAGSHFYGKVALNEPQNYAVPERVEEARAPRTGYLAQGFVVPDLGRIEADWRGAPLRRMLLRGVPGLPDSRALQLHVPGSGALALLVQES